jgi:hypothetical protein
MYATQHDNRSTKKHFGSPPTEKMICEWTKRERIINVKEESTCFFLHCKMA